VICTLNLLLSWIERGWQYETFLVFCAAQRFSPADHTSFLPESPRPVVDRSIDYTLVMGLSL